MTAASGPASDPKRPLPAIFAEWLASSIDANGAGLTHALQVGRDGGMIVHALDLPPDQVYRYVIARWTADRPRELIFAIDRFAREGQGTTLRDLVAGLYLTSERPRPFIIEYQHEPRIVQPIDWSNAFWNDRLRQELRETLQAAASPC